MLAISPQRGSKMQNDHFNAFYYFPTVRSFCLSFHLLLCIVSISFAEIKFTHFFVQISSLRCSVVAPLLCSLAVSYDTGRKGSDTLQLERYSFGNAVTTSQCVSKPVPFITMLQLCSQGLPMSICLSSKRMNCDKMKPPSKERSIMTNRKSTTGFPMSLKRTAYVVPKPQRRFKHANLAFYV